MPVVLDGSSACCPSLPLFPYLLRAGSAQWSSPSAYPSISEFPGHCALRVGLRPSSTRLVPSSINMIYPIISLIFFHVLRAAALPAPDHPHAHDLHHGFSQSLPSQTWYQDSEHPVHGLFRRDAPWRWYGLSNSRLPKYCVHFIFPFPVFC